MRRNSWPCSIESGPPPQSLLVRSSECTCRPPRPSVGAAIEGDTRSAAAYTPCSPLPRAPSRESNPGSSTAGPEWLPSSPCGCAYDCVRVAVCRYPMSGRWRACGSFLWPSNCCHRSPSAALASQPIGVTGLLPSPGCVPATCWEGEPLLAPPPLARSTSSSRCARRAAPAIESSEFRLWVS